MSEPRENFEAKVKPLLIELFKADAEYRRETGSKSGLCMGVCETNAWAFILREKEDENAPNEYLCNITIYAEEVEGVNV